MCDTYEIIRKYTTGKVSLEETNAELKAHDSGLHLDPEKNRITEEEFAQTVVGATPAQVSGWGLLDTGTASLDKVHVVAGQLQDVDLSDTYAIVLIAGHIYHVVGHTLVN